MDNINNLIETILVVEDDPLMRDLVKLILGRLENPSRKFEVIVVRDGIEALDCVRQRHPQIILLDILLPNLNGLDFLKQAKVEGLLTTSQTIVISALGYREVVQQALMNGATDFVLKPFSADVLRERVLHAMQHIRGLSDELSKP